MIRTMADFIASEAFDGSKEGYVFQTGAKGTGYYKNDGTAPAESSEGSGDASKAETLALLQQRMKELEVQATAKEAHEKKEALKGTEGDMVEPVFSDVIVKFEQERWGMKARLSGGPVVITTVAKDGEGFANGVQLGDVIFKINGVVVDLDREKAVAMIRQGGKAEVHLKRLEGQRPVMMGVQGTAQSVVKGEMSAAEQTRLAAMLGNAKNADTVSYAGQKGVTGVIGESDIKTSTTLAFAGCIDCTYTIDATCTKLFVQGCKNLTLVLKGKLLTRTVEAFKCLGLNLDFHTVCGTLQLDICENVNVSFEKADYFFASAGAKTKDINTSMIVWAGCQGLKVATKDPEAAYETGFDKVKEEYKDLVEERSQFRIRYSKEKQSFVEEKIIRLANGFFSTQKESDEHDARQEQAMEAMAKSMGITIGKKRKGKKFKPNEQCPMGSGKKYKKCCNRMDGTCAKQEMEDMLMT